MNLYDLGLTVHNSGAHAMIDDMSKEHIRVVSRGPWTALPDREGWYRLICRELPTFEHYVPTAQVGDALYMLAETYKFPERRNKNV